MHLDLYQFRGPLRLIQKNSSRQSSGYTAKSYYLQLQLCLALYTSITRRRTKFFIQNKTENIPLMPFAINSTAIAINIKPVTLTCPDVSRQMQHNTEHPATDVSSQVCSTFSFQALAENQATPTTGIYQTDKTKSLSVMRA